MKKRANAANMTLTTRHVTCATHNDIKVLFLPGALRRLHTGLGRLVLIVPMNGKPENEDSSSKGKARDKGQTWKTSHLISAGLRAHALHARSPEHH